MAKNDNNSSENIGVSVFTLAREKMEANLDENLAELSENHKICAQNLTKFIKVIPAVLVLLNRLNLCAIVMIMV